MTAPALDNDLWPTVGHLVHTIATQGRLVCIFPTDLPVYCSAIYSQWKTFKYGMGVGMGTGDRFICETGLSIAVNQSKTGPPSKRFGFLCMHRVPGGVIKLSAPTSSLASQCLPSAMIKQPFQNLPSLVPFPLSLCSEAF